MFVDSWQAVTWAILDAERNPKPAYFAIKESFQPILAIASVNDDKSSKIINISVINDSRSEFSKATVSIECFDNNNELNLCWEQSDVIIASNSISDIASVPLNMVGSEFVIDIKSRDGEVISSNHYSKGDY
jgi:beta-mannosidase